MLTWRASYLGVLRNKASVAASGKLGVLTLRLAIEKEVGSLDLKALISQTDLESQCNCVVELKAQITINCCQE